MANSTRSTLGALLSYAQALYNMYYHMHWRSEGENYYGDHLLFQRLYEDMPDEIDGIAEKAIGILNDTKAVNPVENTAAAAKILSELMSDEDEPSTYSDTAVKAERQFVQAVADALNLMEKEGELTDGVEDLLQGIASKHEEHLYLLQQRSKRAMGPLAKLYKLAYTLDKKGAYDEAKEIEKAMESLAKRVGLSPNDMVALADYFDNEGDTVLAAMFDDMLAKVAKKQKEQRPPKKWWDKMAKEIKEGSPDYSEERVAQTIGDIWFNNLTEKKRKEISDRDRKPEKKEKK